MTYNGYNNFPVPLESVSPYADIFAATRFLMTGDSQSATPTDGILTYPTKEAIRDLFSGNPCTRDADGNFAATMTEDDIAWFNKAAGASVALSLMNTPTAGEYARTLVKVKIGPVEETLQDGLVIETAKTWLESEYQKSLLRIGCVGDELKRRAAANRQVVGTMPTRGPRTHCSDRGTVRDAGRCGSPLYNGNRGGY